ncbi:hypothetical protein ACO0QE_000550 [Hanseniaspora vineae]
MENYSHFDAINEATVHEQNEEDYAVWDQNLNNIQQSDAIDEDDLEDEDNFEWEDVPLDSFKFEIKQTKTKKEVSTEKRKRSLDFKRKWLNSAFFCHIQEIPLFLSIFQRQYISWVGDYRNYALIKKKVIPKLIKKKFSDWDKLPRGSSIKEGKCRTLLLGACMWFRSNYKINGNGVRQSPYRLRNLIFNEQYLSLTSKSKQTTLAPTSVEMYYGRKSMTAAEFRHAIKAKKTNRDQLVFVFYIILLALLDLSDDNDELRIVFSLPVHDYKRVQCLTMQTVETIMKLDHTCPNISDSDLFSPYYWIEYKSKDYIYTIDPVMELDRDYIVQRVKINEYQPHFQKNCTKSGLDIQSHYYIVGINEKFEIMDLSARYLNNIMYRVEPCLINIGKNKDWRSFCVFKNALKRKAVYACNFVDVWDSQELKDLRQMSLQNMEKPKTLYALKTNPNYVSDLFVRKNLEVIKGKPVDFGNVSKSSITVYLKKDLCRMRSEYHWLMLGRSLNANAEATYSRRTYKKTQNSTSNGLKKRRLFTATNELEVINLYTFDQTHPTPRLPNMPSIEDYKNEFGDIKIFNIQQLTPTEYDVVPKVTTYFNDFILDNIKLIRKHNIRHSDFNKKLQYLEVVTGFNFKKKPGFAIPLKNHIMVSKKHHEHLLVLQKREIELHYLNEWYWLLKKLHVQKRVEQSFE